jgi:hypothetical protein
VEAFAKHLAEYANSDLPGLQCQLNGYSTPKPHAQEPEKEAA